MASIERDLSRALEAPETLPVVLDLAAPHRFIILSDQHKGARDGADEFRLCETAYRTALEEYLRRSFALILLGDAEELWEQGFAAVESAYSNILELEGRFPAGRYFRVWGNHDDDWMSERLVRKRLLPYMPATIVYEGLRFEVFDGPDRLGTLFMVHGHQGTFFSHKLRGLSRFFLRVFYRPIQRLFRIGRQTPAKDACLRAKHDRQMYEWAAGREDLVLVAGHTHRPVWSSRTHLQKLEAELAELERRGDRDSPDVQRRLAELRQEVEERAAKYPPCGDTIKPLPCYFNTGCCKFDDGDITGIEIEDGVMRLIKWSSEAPELGSQILEEGRLKDIFAAI
jgi:UDP-2,3-diacylglucosamine pyrophosphatase LpxH